MATNQPIQVFSGIVDRPKTLLTVLDSGRIQPLEVLFIRVLTQAQKHQLAESPLETLALAVTPQMLSTNQPIRYADNIVVRGRLETVHVLTRPQDRRQVASLLRDGRDKILQVQAEWSGRYIGQHASETKWGKQLATAAKNWPLGLGLAAYQGRVRKIAWQHRGATRKTIDTLQRHQREINAQTRAEILALTTPLALLRKPAKRVFTNPLFGRPQRPREAMDVIRLASDSAYLHQQAQEIMQDYQYAGAHHLPLSGKGTLVDDMELARWQRWVDERYLPNGE